MIFKYFHIILFMVLVNISVAQKTNFEEAVSYDFHSQTVLIDDRNYSLDISTQKTKSILELEQSLQIQTSKNNYRFDVSGLDFSPMKLKLEERSGLYNPDNFLMLCNPLKEGIYQNFNSQDIIFGAGIDYLINDILLKDLLNFEINIQTRN